MNNNKSDVIRLPLSCWECLIESCRLPYSKIINGKKLMEYSYQRHPKCPLQVIERPNKK